MTINEEIKEILKECSIPQKDGLVMLLGYYHGLEASFFPTHLKGKLYASGILGEENGTIQWKVALFSDQVTGFEWVEAWMKSFGDINKERRGSKSAVMGRMKKFFIQYSDVRQQEVIGATNMYLKTVTDPTYLKKSEKFIFEGVGTDKTSLLKEWIDRYKEITTKENDGTRFSKRNTMS